MSERQTFKECQQRWWWGWRMGYQHPTARPNALWFGSGIHLALAHYYQPQGKSKLRGFKRGPHPAEVWEKYAAEEYGRFFKVGKPSEIPEEEFVDLRELGTIMLEGYVDHYKGDENWEFLAPEQAFSVVLQDENFRDVVNHVGTVDGALRDHADGRAKILETKTAAAISLKHLLLDDQAGDYWMVSDTFMQALGFLRPGEHISDIVFNFLRKAKPDGRATDAEGYALNLDGKRSKRQPKPLFVREPVTRTPAELLSVKQHILDEVAQMADIVSGRHNPTKNPGYNARNCMGCPFIEMCELHEQGGDWEEYAEMVYIQRDPYADHRVGAKSSKF
jgi:hypothetical protein